jgi:hypothetical protein
VGIDVFDEQIRRRVREEKAGDRLLEVTRGCSVVWNSHFMVVDNG